MQRVSLKAVFREKELWLLILLGILYFYRPLFLGETFFFRDLSYYTLLQKRLLVDFIHAKELPLWDSYLHGGQPYLASLNLFALYPLNILYFFLPLFRAFNLNIVLHLILGPVFAYLFSRILGLQPISSFITGVVYGFCGYILSLVNLVVMFLVMPYLPLLFMFWHLFLFERKRKWFIMAVIVGLVRVLAGAPEANVMGMLSLLGLSLCYPYPYTSHFRRIVYWTLLGIFTLGLASVQIFPTIEMVLQSSRGTGFDYSGFSQWSLHPTRILEVFFPEFLGHVDTLLWDVYYWGGELIDARTPYILSIYFGCVAVVLAILGGMHRGNDRIFPFKARIFLLSLFIISLVFSMGRYLPFFYLLYRYVPLITIFRYPIKFLMAGLLPLALLAGYASEVSFGKYSPNIQKASEETISEYSPPWFLSSKTLIAAWSISAILFIFTIMFWLSTGFANHIQGFLFKRFGGDIAHRGMATSFAHATVIWLLFTLLYQYRRLQKRYWLHWVLAGVLAIDLLSAGRRVNHYAPEEFFTDIPPIVQTVRNEIGDGRLFRAMTPEKFTLNVPSYNVIWLHRYNFEVLDSYLAIFYGIPVIFHGDPDAMAPKRLKELKNRVDSLSWKQRLPLLSAGGVTLILTEEILSIPGIHRIAEIPNRSNVPFYLYRNETAAARVQFVKGWEVVDSDADALEAMLRPNYDPRKHVVFQEPESDMYNSSVRMQQVQNNDTTPSDCSNIQLKKITSNNYSAMFSVSNSCDGHLVFSEPFYPGWRIYVDGKPTPILRANLAFSAIFLQAGEHEVKRSYRPNSLLLGILSSVLFCSLLGLVTYKGWFFGND